MAAALSGLRGEPAGGPARTSCGRAPASHGELSMSGKSRSDVLAAGAIVWRVAGRRLEVLLIHRPRYDDWSWPKGKLDGAHEPLAMCAVREVQEETGVAVRLGAKLPTVKYKLGTGCARWFTTGPPHPWPPMVRQRVRCMHGVRSIRAPRTKWTRCVGWRQVRLVNY